MTVFALWSSPRSRSTAFFRSMAERGDLLVLHEPFFDVRAVGHTEIDGDRFTTAEELVRGLVARTDGQDLFFKETTDHRYEAIFTDQRFLGEIRHVFLIRRPEEIAASYHALHPDMRRHEIGLETLEELYTAVAGAGGHQPVVIDSDDLVIRPTATIAAYCHAVGLPFLARSLRWPPGDRPEWRQTARWHQRTASSSGFERGTRQHEQTVENSERLASFAAHHRPFYDRLHARRLVPMSEWAGPRPPGRQVD